MSVNVHGSRSSIHRLALKATWIDNGWAAIWLTWGDQCCDPVWSIDLDFRLPNHGTLARLVDRLAA